VVMKRTHLDGMSAETKVLSTLQMAEQIKGGGAAGEGSGPVVFQVRRGYVML
jgi:hypothetical protein